ncbi:MAG: hypothetical protein RIT81_46470 [Deltaproteobacteria bacterium]
MRLPKPWSTLLLAVAVFAADLPDVYANEGPIVAVFEIEDTSRRKKKLIRALTDYLRVKLAEEGSVRVVDKSEQRRQMKKLMKREKKKSYRTCVDASCQIPLGKELAADKILRSRLNRFGSNFVITTEVLDLASEASAGAASAKSDGSDEGLMRAVEEIAKELLVVLVPPPPPPPPEVAEAPPPPPPPPPPPVEVKDEMVTPPATGGELALIFGGWSAFGAAYLTNIVIVLVEGDISDIYYSLFPIVGPILYESTKFEELGDKKNVLSYIGAGVQLVGALAAVLGHILVETKDPVPKSTLEAEGDAVTWGPVLTPNGVGIGGTF